MAKLETIRTQLLVHQRLKAIGISTNLKLVFFAGARATIYPQIPLLAKYYITGLRKNIKVSSGEKRTVRLIMSEASLLWHAYT